MLASLSRSLKFLTIHAPDDLHAWSGTIVRMRHSLGISKSQCILLDDMRVKFIQRKWMGVKTRVWSKLFGEKYLWQRDPIQLGAYARQVKQDYRGNESNIFFCPSSLPISYLHTSAPMCFWTDATFAGMLGFNPQFSGLCRESVRHGNDAEQRALKNCTLALYASQWAAKAAIANYDIDPQKIHVVPFGANIDCSRDEFSIKQISEAKSEEVCKLLFAGVDWEWKGGDKAVEILRLLLKRGVNAELHIVGCTPNCDLGPNAFVHGFVSKASVEGRAKLDKLFSEAHFLVLPTRTEAYGLVFAEASSFGLPSLGTNIGGIPTVLREGRNGFLFDLEADVSSYCDRIEALLGDFDSYRALALSSFLEYKRDLNWDAAGARVRELINEHCN